MKRKRDPKKARLIVEKTTRHKNEWQCFVGKMSLLALCMHYLRVLDFRVETQ